MTACRPAAAPSGTAEAPRGDGTASHEDGAANASSSGGTVKAAGEPEKTPPTHRGGTGNVRTKPKTRAKRRPGTNGAQAQTAKSDVVRGGHEETSLQGREEQDLAGPKDQATPGAALKRHLEKLGASAQQDRRAFVYGDGNAARLKWAALKAVGWNKRVMFRGKEGASLQELCSSVDLAEDIWQTPAAIVVLHAGSLEMSDGSSTPESSVSQLRALLTKWLQKAQGHRFVVYALTERGSGSETHINPCREWNVAVRKMCEELGPRVEFVGASWRLGHGQQGPSYRDDTADQLGQRLAVCFFRPTNAHQTLGAAKPIVPSSGNVDDSSGTGHHTDGGGTAPPQEWEEALPGGPPQVVDIRTPSGRASHERHTRKRRRCRHGLWARGVYKYIHLRSVRTKWVARTRSLSERYRMEAIRLTAPLQRDTRKKVRESVSAVETERWRESGRAKRALALYWEAKTDIAKEALYDNSRGSGLLCEARSGVLRTRSLRARYTAELDTMCPLCQGAEETIRHIVLECTGLRPAIHDAQDSGTSAQGATGATNDNSALARALGFRGSFM
ncbi:hypothetical protein HPB52_009849 [Rhipicephalus sanguineus]|uniref:Uncharacterized protein n=1 Tax=Rhipicephalus sanguineus TaxID=34632 RepID=A0A9D4Q8K5_RHISA|nr:hypothetical protein HPB52_009849 [Rhipicephalus sanguineus]